MNANKKHTTRNSFILILTAFIWGVAFVAQTEGGNTVGPFTFNCVRSLIGSVALLPVIYCLDRRSASNHKDDRVTTGERNNRTLLLGGVLCGIILCIASNLQQLGITMGSSAGKAGFLTACYILIVPIIGIFLGRHCGINIWIGVIIALAGLYLLCMEGSWAIQLSDLLLLLCALCFAFHIIVIDHFSPLVDGVRMSCIQFMVSGLLTAIPMTILEIGLFTPNFSAADFTDWLAPFQSIEAWIPILYAGVFSCGVAYTLQIVGQKGINPTVASLLLSLESAFAAIAGWLILGQSMDLPQLAGCLLLFVAVVLAQIKLPDKRGNK